jgi:hypothetical protein
MQLLGKIKTKSGCHSSPVDTEPCPIITPQATPNLLLNHAAVEASRVKLENVWSTIDDFPTVDNPRVCCLYCNTRFMEFIETPEATRWFIPLRQEKKEDLYLVEEPPGEEDDDESNDESLNEPISPSGSGRTYYVYSGEGMYCSYFCAYMQLKTRDMSVENRNKQLKLLGLMYKDLYGVKAPVIDTPVVKDHIEEYGGYISRFTYKNHAFTYERNNIPGDHSVL